MVASRQGNTESCKLLSDAESGCSTIEQFEALSMPWYHGRINRAAGEHILSLNGSRDGLFLVRWVRAAGVHAAAQAGPGPGPAPSSLGPSPLATISSRAHRTHLALFEHDRRESSSAAGDYVLTMCFDGIAYHFQIQHEGADCFFIDDGPVFQGERPTDRLAAWRRRPLRNIKRAPTLFPDSFP